MNQSHKKLASIETIQIEERKKEKVREREREKEGGMI